MASPVDLQTVIAIVTVAASAGAAWAGVKAGLNGMRATVRRIEAALTTHAARLETHIESDQLVQIEAVRSSSRIETKVEGLDEKIDKITNYVDELRESR